jgi:chagasin family peptidase inhibitor I42
MRIHRPAMRRGSGFRLALAALGVSGLLQGCAPLSDTGVAYDIPNLDPYDPQGRRPQVEPRYSTAPSISQQVVGKVDQEVVVRLDSQPGTGYTWHIVNALPGLDYLGSTTESVPGSAPGRGAVQSFRFIPRIVDSFTLDFVLQRPWEDQPIDRRRVLIRAS